MKKRAKENMPKTKGKKRFILLGMILLLLLLIWLNNTSNTKRAAQYGITSPSKLCEISLGLAEQVY
jgi:hypothetical protein